MEQIEGLTTGSSIPLVEQLDSLHGLLNERSVLGQRLFRRIGKVGEQCKRERFVSIREEVTFQAMQKCFDFLRAREQGRHDHDRGILRRDSFLEVETRQEARRQ
jgi:hypothetical protein